MPDQDKHAEQRQTVGGLGYFRETVSLMWQKVESTSN